MLKQKQIAVISPFPLINIGLRYLLQVYFSAPVPALYTCAGSFLADNPEKYDIYLVSGETFVCNGDFFLPRKNRTILLTEYPCTITDHSISHLCIREEENNLVDQLQQILKPMRQRTESDSHEELSPREIEVLQLVARGCLNKEIADRLNISINTVLSHRKNITCKLGIKTVSGLSFYAMMNGYIVPSAEE